MAESNLKIAHDQIVEALATLSGLHDRVPPGLEGWVGSVSANLIRANAAIERATGTAAPRDSSGHQVAQDLDAVRDAIHQETKRERDELKAKLAATPPEAPTGCPKCGTPAGHETAYDSLVHGAARNDGKVIQRGWCVACGAEWLEIWRFEKVRILKGGKRAR